MAVTVEQATMLGVYRMRLLNKGFYSSVLTLVVQFQCISEGFFPDAGGFLNSGERIEGLVRTHTLSKIVSNFSKDFLQLLFRVAFAAHLQLEVFSEDIP